MPKEEWGVKRACPKCSVRFYDLQKDPMTCPSCGASYDISSLTQQKSRIVEVKKEKPEAAEAVESAKSDDLETDSDILEEDEAVIDELDDELLDEEEDDDETVNLEEIADVAGETDES